MLQSCIELEYLNLSNFGISKVIYMERMFKNCPKLKEIKGKNHKTNNVFKEKILKGEDHKRTADEKKLYLIEIKRFKIELIINTLMI